MYFPLPPEFKNCIFFLDRYFTGLTNFPLLVLSSIACQKAVFLSTPISNLRNKAKKRARNKSSFIATKHVQNIIKLKQNILNNLFQYFSNFFRLSLGCCQFHLRVLSKHSLRIKCPYTELFWSKFSHNRTEYGEIRSISRYSLRMRENAD